MLENQYSCLIGPRLGHKRMLPGKAGFKLKEDICSISFYS